MTALVLATLPLGLAIVGHAWWLRGWYGYGLAVHQAFGGAVVALPGAFVAIALMI